MIKEKTLFILGAGAHKPYDFPVAKELKQYIITQYLKNFCTLINAWGVRSEIMFQELINQEKSFLSEFDKSGIYSIDNFLSLRPEFKKSGIRAIIITLLEFEFRHKDNRQKYIKDDWFQYLYNKSISGINIPEDKDKFLENNFAFITFNYDRMIENYFDEYLRFSFKLSKGEQLKKFLDHCNIKHVYGSLGKIYDENCDELDLPYGNKIDFDRLESLIKNIQTINVDRESPSSQLLAEIIPTYDRIFFLGFSYAEENLKALNIPNCLRKDQRVIGTAYGFTENEIFNLREKLFSSSWVQNDKHDLVIVNQDNLTLLRNYL